MPNMLHSHTAQSIWMNSDDYDVAQAKASHAAAAQLTADSKQLSELLQYVIYIQHIKTCI